MDSYRFTHLRLENWRNFQSADVAVTRRVFLIGPNASGKSNLLDSLRFLHDLCDVGGGFQRAVQQRGGVSRLRSLAARRFPAITLSASIGTDDAPTMWTYDLSFTQNNLRQPVIEAEQISRNGECLLDRPNADDTSDTARLSQTFLEQVNVNREFRDLVHFFRSIEYHHIIPHLVRDPDRSVGRSNDPFGGDFLERVARTSPKTRDSRLRRIGQALRVAVPQLDALELNRDERGRPHLRGRYSHWRPTGAWQEESDFSDGTLRLLGLLWALLDGSGPLLLEEPELSLHPEVVKYLPAMFDRVQRRSGRQIIMSTHSPDLLRDEGVGLDEVLVLMPTDEGTTIRTSAEMKHIRLLMGQGVALPDAVMPATKPERAGQLILFE